MAHPEEVEVILQAGARKARALATPFMQNLRQAVGLRALTAQASPTASRKAAAGLPGFKQYREADGRFYFKLTDAHGAVLLQSQGFASPREAGQAVKRLQAEGAAALQALAPQLQATPDPAAPALRQALDQLLSAASQA
jgi:tryptophanyl-tRNA synthetase